MNDKAFGVASDDCGAILRELRDAVHLDDQELKKRAYETPGRECLDHVIIFTAAVHVDRPGRSVGQNRLSSETLKD